MSPGLRTTSRLPFPLTPTNDTMRLSCAATPSPTSDRIGKTSTWSNMILHSLPALILFTPSLCRSTVPTSPSVPTPAWVSQTNTTSLKLIHRIVTLSTQMAQVSSSKITHLPSSPRNYTCTRNRTLSSHSWLDTPFRTESQFSPLTTPYPRGPSSSVDRGRGGGAHLSLPLCFLERFCQWRFQRLG